MTDPASDTPFSAPTSLDQALQIIVQLQTENATLNQELQQTRADLQQLRQNPSGAAADLGICDAVLRQIFDGLPDTDIFFLRSLNPSKLLYLSPSYDQIYQAPGQAVYDDPTAWLNAIHPEDRDRMQTHFEQEAQGAAFFDCEYRIVRPDGSIRWIWDRSFPIYNQAGQLDRFAGINRDITERKTLELQLQQLNHQLEQSIQERTTQLQLASSSAQLRTWTLDLNTWEEWWSQEEYKDLGYYPGEQGEVLDEQGQVISPHPTYELFLERVHPEDRPRIQQLLQAALAQHSFYESEYRLVRPDGSLRWRYCQCIYLDDLQGQPTKLLGISMDITDRKQAELALRDSETLFRAISEQMPEGLFLLDLDDPDVSAKIIYANEGACQMHGCSREDLLGQPVTVMDTPETAARAEERIQELLTGDIVRFEADHQRADGSCYPVEVSARLIMHQGRRAILAIVRDVSDRKTVERSLQAAEKRLRASLQEKDILLQEVHHRVKNNLQIISSLLNLQANTLQNPHLKAALIDSQQRVKVMAMVHERLYRSETLATLNLGEYVQKLADDLLSSYIPIGVPIRLAVQVVPVQVEADVVISCGLLINELVSNATKYAFPAGRSGTILVSLVMDAAQNYILTIKDDGIGLPEHLNLHQTESLGLQIVCALVKQLEGTIELNRSTGTTFTITFSSCLDSSLA